MAGASVGFIKTHIVMKILVTGGAGFIGSNLVRLLVQKKDESVVNIDKLTYAANPESLSDLDGDPNYIFELVDLWDAGALGAVFERYEPDAVIHLAAESHVDRSIQEPSEFIQTNVVGTYNLLQASLEYWNSLPDGYEANRLKIKAVDKSAFRFIHVSTDEVYGALNPNDSPFVETSLLKPNSPYSASKAAADHLVQSWYATYGLPTIITRCGNNYGANQHPEKLIPKVIQCCLNAEVVPVYGTGANVRDWISVQDHCDALYCILNNGRIGEVYNIGANNELSNLELVRFLCDILNDQAPMNDERSDDSPKSYQDLITFVADRPGHDLRYAIDFSKLRNELDWRPQQDFASSLSDVVEWHMNHLKSKQVG